MAAYQLCFFAGVARTGVTVGTIIGIGSSPILAGLIGFFVRGELPSKRWVWATLLAILGSGMLVLSGGEVRVDLLGVLLAVVAGGAYATFTVASKNLLDNHPPEAVMAVSFCLGALLLSPVLLFNDLSWLAQPAGWLVIGHLGLVTVALAYTLFGYGLQRVRIATAATLTLAEPLTAAMLGVFLLGERLNLPAWLGVGMVFAGLAILSIADKKSGSN
jgi:DME family drug/metabolite transporter